MGSRIRLEQAGTGVVRTAGNIVARLFASSAGTAYEVVELQPNQDVGSVFGFGAGPECARQHGRLVGEMQLAMRLPTTTPGTIGAVSETPAGTGPTIVVSGSPNDRYRLRVKVSQGGLPGAGRIAVALDGGSYLYDYDIPPEVPARLTGTVDLTGAGVVAGLDGLTLVTIGLVSTTTFASPATPQDVVDQVQAAFDAAPIAARATLWEGKFLRIESLAGGINALLGANASSTAETNLGLTTTPATTRITGTVDLTGVGVVAALDGLTLVTTGLVSTTTFASPATAQDVVAQVQAAFDAAPIAATASLVEAKYLRIESDNREVIGVSASSTAETNLGMAQWPATGGPAILALAGTGLSIEFPATSPYVANTVYAADTTGPRFSLTDLLTGLNTLKESGIPFGFVHVVQEPANASELRAWCNALDTVFAGWKNADDDRFGSFYILGAPVDGSDADLRDAFADHVSEHGLVAAGGLYGTGSEVALGSYLRSLAWATALRRAGLPISSDPGDGTAGPLLEWSLYGPDGAEARNESTATIKLRPKGFTVVKKSRRLPVIVRGVTRAGNTNLFADIAVLAVGLAAFNIVAETAEAYRNIKLRSNPDGTIEESSRVWLEGVYQKRLELLVTEGHAQAVAITVDPTPIATGTGAAKLVKVKFEVQSLIQVEGIDGTVTIVETLTQPVG